MIVVDENGNEYEATYPKRAKGLIKNGRARFIEENKICLLCPPNIETEDNTMSENKKTNNSNVETTNNCPIPPIPKDTTDFLTMQYILEQIEKIQKELVDLKNTVNNIGCVSDCDRENDEENTTTNQQIAEKKISAIVEVFNHREESLIKLLSIYEKMYSDLRKDKVTDLKMSIVSEAMLHLSENGEPGSVENVVTMVLNDLNKTV